MSVRLWQLLIDSNNKINSDTFIFILMIIHNIFASIIGIGNLIAWICVQKVHKQFKKTYQDRYLITNGCKDTPTELTISETAMTQILRLPDDDNDNNKHDGDKIGLRDEIDDAGLSFRKLDDNDHD